MGNFDMKIKLIVMETKKFNVVDLSLTEIMYVNGGEYPKIPTWVKGSIWGFVIGVIIDNWAEIKSGAIDGWTAMNET
jgi:hypothetical protein